MTVLDNKKNFEKCYVSIYEGINKERGIKNGGKNKYRFN
jgi:hypothetical protein